MAPKKPPADDAVTDDIYAVIAAGDADAARGRVVRITSPEELAALQRRIAAEVKERLRRERDDEPAPQRDEETSTPGRR